MTIDVRLTELAAGLGFPESPLVLTDGSVVVSEVATGRLSRVAGGRVHPIADLGGGPNGLLADGEDILVCQNGGASWAEVAWPFDLPGAVRMRLPHGPPPRPVTPAVLRVAPDGSVTTVASSFTTVSGQMRPLSRPSDICADGHGGFYLTDAGATRDRRRELMGLLHGRMDGTVTEVLYPLEMPNGVALAPDGRTLFLTETRTRRVWCIGLDGPGQVREARGFATLDSGGPMNFGGADGICVDPCGYVVVATLGSGGLSVFDSVGRLRLWIPTGDPMTTNATVDEPGDRLLASLAATGRLVAVERWSDVIAAIQSDEDLDRTALVTWR